MNFHTSQIRQGPAVESMSSPASIDVDQTLQPMLDELQNLAESDSNAPSPGEIRRICLYAFAGSRTPKPASHAKHAGSIPCFNKVKTWSTRISGRNHCGHDWSLISMAIQLGKWYYRAELCVCVIYFNACSAWHKENKSSVRMTCYTQG